LHRSSSTAVNDLEVADIRAGARIDDLIIDQAGAEPSRTIRQMAGLTIPLINTLASLERGGIADVWVFAGSEELLNGGSNRFARTRFNFQWRVVERMAEFDGRFRRRAWERPGQLDKQNTDDNSAGLIHVRLQTKGPTWAGPFASVQRILVSY